MKKIILTSLLFISFLSFSCAQKKQSAVKTKNTKSQETEFIPSQVFNSSVLVPDNGNKPFNCKTAYEITDKMKTGWNLGNTLDATAGRNLDSETSWSCPKTTEEMIVGLKKSGINTIRIPTSWHNHIIDSDYTIDPAWMARVKQIVDWAIKNDIYVILNSHHDNYSRPSAMPKCSGYYPNKTNFNESATYLENIWTQIATTFNGSYDEHLIFEVMNEPRLAGTSHEWWFDPYSSDCLEAAECLNKLNQIALDAIRKTGGNNQNRFVMIPALQASPDSAKQPAFKMPVDDRIGKLILSVHMYTPYSFAMEMPGETKFTNQHKTDIENILSSLVSYFIGKGYPVIIGEYGATNKENLTERVEWFKYFLSTSKQHDIIAILWDNYQPEGSTTEGERYGYYNRTKQSWYFPEIIKTIDESTK